MPPIGVIANSRLATPSWSASTCAGLPYFQLIRPTARIVSTSASVQAGVGDGLADGERHQSDRIESIVEALEAMEGLAGADEDGGAGIDRHGRRG
ncbi:MAG: hypothetical protein R2713_08845 [Ilumatobacteraceae bacterium]